MVPFKIFDTVSYSPSIITMALSVAISEIFNFKELSDLEIWVCGRSRSLKMARFDRPCISFYGFAIVTIAPPCTVVPWLPQQIQDGGGRHLYFNFRKMSITPDWIRISAPNIMERCIMAMRI